MQEKFKILLQDVSERFIKHTFNVKTNKQTNKNSLCDKDRKDNIIWVSKEFVVRMIPNINTLYRQNRRIIQFNPLKPELNPICYLLALLGAHHFLHVSRIRVKLLTLR